MERLFLHVGMHKTGTTALQNFFYANRERLLEEGLCYPDIGIQHHGPLAAAVREGDLRPLLDVLAAERNSRHPHVLISSEDFVRQAQKLAVLRRQVPVVTVIIYLRRQDYYVQSMYQETVKSPEMRAAWTFADYYAGYWNAGTQQLRRRLDWHALVGDWAEAFGQENVVVRPYDRGRFAGGNIFAEFLSLLGLAMSDQYVLPSREKSNIGLSPEMVELIRRSNDTRGKREQAVLVELLNEFGAENPEIKGGQKYDYLSPAQRIELLEAVDEKNRLLAREYLGREDGRLFLEPWPDPGEPWEPPRLEVASAAPGEDPTPLQRQAEALAVLIAQARVKVERLERVQAIAAALRGRASGAPRSRLDRLWQRRNARLVVASGLFDRDYYLATYPDIARFGDPAEHYVTHGWLEGRNPSPSFDTLGFLADHPDVLASGVCPLVMLAKRKPRRGA